MVEIVDNKWRPFIKLTSVVPDEYVYLDVTLRPIIVATDMGTEIYLPNYKEGHWMVNESVDAIIAAVDKMIEAEQDKKAEEARQYMEATMARVAETKKQLENN